MIKVLEKLTISALSPWDVISLMASLSPSDVIAEPASMEFTPISSNFVAILNFFIEFSEIPGVCSPSLNVVSNTSIFIETPKSSKNYCYFILSYVIYSI